MNEFIIVITSSIFPVIISKLINYLFFYNKIVIDKSKKGKDFREISIIGSIFYVLIFIIFYLISKKLSNMYIINFNSLIVGLIISFLSYLIVLILISKFDLSLLNRTNDRFKIRNMIERKYLYISLLQILIATEILVYTFQNYSFEINNLGILLLPSMGFIYFVASSHSNFINGVDPLSQIRDIKVILNNGKSINCNRVELVNDVYKISRIMFKNDEKIENDIYISKDTIDRIIDEIRIKKR